MFSPDCSERFERMVTNWLKLGSGCPQERQPIRAIVCPRLIEVECCNTATAARLWQFKFAVPEIGQGTKLRLLVAGREVTFGPFRTSL